MPGVGPPVLVMRMSAEPHSLAAACTNCWQSSGFETSAVTGRILTPGLAAVISRAVCSSWSRFRPQMATLQPSAARVAATARPRPLLAAATRGGFSGYAEVHCVLRAVVCA